MSQVPEEGAAVILISGPMAAGKTTIARLLAERFTRGVHLEGDLFRRSIVSGRAEATPELSPEALAQLRLRYRLGAAAADTYAEAGFTVVLEDVVAGPMLEEWRTLVRTRPCQLVVLLPSVVAIEEREAARAETGYDAWTIRQLYEVFADATPRVGLWLDPSEQTPVQTVDAILAET